MSRQIVIVLLGALLASVAPAPPALARGANDEYPGTVSARVRYINQAQQLVFLDDGTVLRALRPGQLAVLHEGDTVRLQYISTAGTKLIERIESVSR